MSAITPNADQFREFATSVDEGPVVMLNLLKFKGGDGAREYDAYGGAATRMVAEGGGRVLYVGRCDQVLIGDESEKWDAIALVEYPSRKAFIEMVSRKDYQAAHAHREAGLERTVLLATTPRQREGAQG
jgi:uncharacterized protein (DUF1330 family)